MTELRADLVEQAQENVRAHHDNEADAHNVKVLVERKTVYYKVGLFETTLPCDESMAPNRVLLPGGIVKLFTQEVVRVKSPPTDVLTLWIFDLGWLYSST